MDHPETDNLLAPTQNPEIHPPPARKGLWSRLMSAWNSNPVQMRLMLLSLLFYMADVITDTMLATQYYNNGDYYWFGCTLGFVMAPPAVMNILLLVFDIDLLDIKLSVSKLEKCLLNIFCLSLPLKYFQIINLLSCGKEVKESLKKKLYRFHLVEAILESLPQLCLQIYIISSTHEQFSVLQVISMVMSLLAAVKAVVTYMYYDRRSTYVGSYIGLEFVIIGKALELSLRVLTIAMFASVYKLWVLLPIGLHWLVMAFCIVIETHQKRYKDVTKAYLLLATCIFSTTFPNSKGYRRRALLLVLNLALTYLSNFVMYSFFVNNDLYWMAVNNDLYLIVLGMLHGSANQMALDEGLHALFR